MIILILPLVLIGLTIFLWTREKHDLTTKELSPRWATVKGILSKIVGVLTFLLSIDAIAKFGFAVNIGETLGLVVSSFDSAYLIWLEVASIGGALFAIWNKKAGEPAEVLILLNALNTGKLKLEDPASPVGILSVGNISSIKDLVKPIL